MLPESDLLRVDEFKSYITKLLSITLDSSICYSEDDAANLLALISLPTSRAIYFNQSESQIFSSAISSQKTVLSLIKKFDYITSSTTIQSQVSVIDHSINTSTNKYSIIIDYLEHSAARPLDSSDEKGNSVRGVQAVSKKIAELEILLVNLKQSFDIPVIVLESSSPIIGQTIINAKSKSYNYDQGISELIKDSVFLNQIQGDVNQWIKGVQRVTMLAREESGGIDFERERMLSRDGIGITAWKEIEFWIGMKNSLSLIEIQLNAPHVALTLDILKAAKRFHATVSFIADTGFKEASELVNSYNLLMKDFPIDDLLSALDLHFLGSSLTTIFVHLNKKLRVSAYPINRALLFVEAISSDFNIRLLAIISSANLLSITYTDFKVMMQSLDTVFKMWDEGIKDFIALARDVSRRRSDSFVPIKIGACHVRTQERLLDINTFRIQHEQLLETLGQVYHYDIEIDYIMTNDVGYGINNSRNVVSDGERRAKKDSTIFITDGKDENEKNSKFYLMIAIEGMLTLDLLDVSVKGTEAYKQAEDEYNLKVSIIEHKITRILCTKLSASKNAAEMFKIFSKFNSLFERPRIRGAIHEYQALLIDRVKDDMKKLYSKFIDRYNTNAESLFIEIRDIPLIASKVMWAGTIKRQLNDLMTKIEHVLGSGWEQYSEGQKLREQELLFCQKLDPTGIYDKWVIETVGMQIITGPIFMLGRDERNKEQYQLKINFDCRYISLFKDVRNLERLGYNLPLGIKNMAENARIVYPFAVSLKGILGVYARTLNILSKNESCRVLVARHHQNVQESISRNIAGTWECLIDACEDGIIENEYCVFVTELGMAIELFRVDLMTAINLVADTNTVVKKLMDTPYQAEGLALCLIEIQDIINQLDFQNFSNIDVWLRSAELIIEKVLVERINCALIQWNDELMKEKSLLFEEIMTYRLKLRGQNLYIDPPALNARVALIKNLEERMAIVLKLSRLKINQILSEPSNTEQRTYIDLLRQVDTLCMQKCFKTIADVVNRFLNFINEWFRYQALWDYEHSQVFDLLGEDLGPWCTALLDVSQSLDTSKTCKFIGSICIDYKIAQRAVNLKLGGWCQILLTEFASRLGSQMLGFYKKVQLQRYQLEELCFDVDLRQAIENVCFIQGLTISIGDYQRKLDIFDSGEKILRARRFPLSCDWLYIDQVKGEWSSFFQIHQRKLLLMQESNELIQKSIGRENLKFHDDEKRLLVEWGHSKVILDSISPKEALVTLASIAREFTSLHASYFVLLKAISVFAVQFHVSDAFLIAVNENEEATKVCNSLMNIWDSVDQIKPILFESCEIGFITDNLKTLLLTLNSMPTLTQRYQIHLNTINIVANYQSKHAIISMLKTKAIRDRHWGKIFNILGLKVIQPQFLTIGVLWDISFTNDKNTKLADIVLAASQEMVLEQFLADTKMFWISYQLELTPFQNKCRLLVGCDELLVIIQDHLASLAAMQNSTHYPIFQNEALEVERNLSSIYFLIEEWATFQRQWVYLHGILNENDDIKLILPIAVSQFKCVDEEFMALLLKCYSNTFVMEIQLIPNIFQTIRCLNASVSKIERCLGKYLEGERLEFHRFFFLADNELLEILGNFKDLSRIQPHLKKMFQATNRLILSDDCNKINGIASNEGEILIFKEDIYITHFLSARELLQAISDTIESTLKFFLKDAITSSNGDYLHAKVSTKEAINWLDLYPAQIIILASQCKWTLAVESAFDSQDNIKKLIVYIDFFIATLALLVVQDLQEILISKCVAMISELVHQRDITTLLRENTTVDQFDFLWLKNMRYYFKNGSVEIEIAKSRFEYGFEYLGVQNRLIQTPLTDIVFLTLSQALNNRLGGSPFGPAGTGKVVRINVDGKC